MMCEPLGFVRSMSDEHESHEFYDSDYMYITKGR